MNKLKVALVDDEPASLKTLQLLLKKYCPDAEVIASFNDPAIALKEIPQLNIDLLFLDIEMPVMTGFDLLNALKEYKGGVIFATAHSSYAVRAFKFSAVDYLLKPIEADDLKQAVERYSTRQLPKPDAAQISQLAGNLEYLSQAAPKKISLPSGNALEIIVINEIEYIQSDRSYCVVKRTGKPDLIVSKAIKEFEDLLPSIQFARVHASYLVNMEKVERYIRSDGGQIVMNNGTEISLGRTYRDIIVARLKG